MDIHNTLHEAIIKLHERGYEQDFQLHGKGLLWLQGKSFIPPGEFMILECYRMYNPGDHVLVLGINCPGLNLKGILIIHSADNKLIPSGIAKKLHEINAYEQQDIPAKKIYDKRNLKKRLACIMLIYMDGLSNKKKQSLSRYLDKKLDNMVDYYVGLLKNNMSFSSTPVSDN